MTTVRFKFDVAGFRSLPILHESLPILHGFEVLGAFRRPVARTDYASGVMPHKQLAIGYRNSGSRTNWNSRDASACVSRNSASRKSPSGTNTKSHGDKTFVFAHTKFLGMAVRIPLQTMI